MTPERIRRIAALALEPAPTSCATLGCRVCEDMADMSL